MLGLPSIAEALSSDSLVGLDLNGRPFPRVAERWAVENGGRELRFSLAPNIRLHNGTSAHAPLIAHLVQEAMKRPDIQQLQPRFDELYQVEAEGNSTVLVRAAIPRILAIEELANLTLKTGSPDGGLGPFVVDKVTPEGLELHGFRDHFKGPPRLDRLEFRVYRSQRAAWTGMMRDEIESLYEVNRDALEFLERESRVRTYSFLRPYVGGLIFNVTHPVLRDPNIRRALSAAIDRDAIVKGAFRSRARAAGGPLNPQHWALAPGVSIAEYDPKLAEMLLSGLEQQAETGQMPAKLRFRCLVPTFETQPFERTALVIQKQLYSVGVDLQLEQVSFAELMTRLSHGNFDAVLVEFFGATPIWLSYFWHSPRADTPTLINSGYSGSDIELEALDNARTEDELKKALVQVYKRMAEDPPAIFIAWPEVARAVSTRFEVPVEKGRDIMGGNLWLWRPAKQH